jgi:hypothetical protein
MAAIVGVVNMNIILIEVMANALGLADAGFGDADRAGGAI